MVGAVTSRSRTARLRRFKRSLFLVPLGIYLLIMFGYPLYYSIVISFKNLNQITMISGHAPFNGVANYIHAWSGGQIWHTVDNTIEFTVLSIVFQFAIGLLLALLFNRKFPANGFLRSLILVPWLIPQLVSGTIFKWMFDSTDGIINEALVGLHVVHHPISWLLHPQLALIVIIVTNIWIGIPFNMVLIYSGLKDVPHEIYEAAEIDGATKWKSFLHITVPSVRTVFAIVLMLGLIYTLKVFDIVMTLTGGGPENSTQLLSTWSYTLSFTNLNFGQGAAIANGLMIIALIFTGIYLWSNKKALD
ncbi:carbohydrate ABC transporter permease [Alicyclobacillus fastidiosus]|uniref:Sugar ABC transporter permease n=1 Tax=Alicyclobacillus fastidiosus TaxID=392011 RepID=A0ABV5ABE4_9BACL|nr:sugar ABC transporter permease [Alicyclobacillus fastidiosus]WEH10523.1 sugar ABC transporter permease [Alicyclobacillus fastidiosus]